MQKKYILALAFICLGIITLSVLHSEKKNRIEIMAASSLTTALENLSPVLSDDEGISIDLNLASTGVLSHQLENGAKPDIFISASQMHIQALLEKNILRKEQVHSFLSNSLVVVSMTDETPMSTLQDLKERNGIIAIAQPDTAPAGLYARQALENSGIYADLSDRFVYAKNVRQTASYVRLKDADYGFVYKTDMSVLDGAHILLEIDPHLHDPILYPIVDVANTPYSAELIDKLKTEPYIDAFIQEGFQVTTHE